MSVRLEDIESKFTYMERGVRKGCCISSALFNIYGDILIEEALEDTTDLVVRGERIRTIKYADDQAILASSEEELRTMLQKSIDLGQRYRVGINVKSLK